MATYRPNISPEVIKWAREWAGLSFQEVTEKVSSYPKWETGEKLPTMKQLEALANRFHVPLGYFFLSEPPEIETPIPDFRTVQNQRPGRPSPDLMEVLQQMISRQDWLREYLAEEGEEKLPFVGKASPDDSVEETAADIRNTLGLTSLWANEHSSFEAALRHLRDAIEAVRVMVVIMGYAGRSTRRTLDVSEFRGFVLSDAYAPLIFINGRDAKSAQMFTLAHELAHIWINQDALFDLPKLLSPSGSKAEVFCNRVAAEFLVPTAEFYPAWQSEQGQSDPYKRLARRFKVSQVVVARKALDLSLISKSEFFSFYDERISLAGKNRSHSSGGNYWNTQGTRIGRLFGSAVIRALKEGRLLYTDAYDMTGLKSNTLDTFADQMGASL